LVAVLTVAGPTAASAAAPPPVPPDDIVLLPSPPLRGALIANGMGYAVADPEPVAGPGVKSVLVSADGRWVLAACERRRDAAVAAIRGKPQDAPGEESVTVWDARTRQSRPLWRRALAAGEGSSLRLTGWMGTTARATAHLTVPVQEADGRNGSRYAFLVLDPAAGTARLTTFPTAGYYSPNPSPAAPFAALVNAEGGGSGKLLFLRPDGSLTAPVALPHFIWFTRWSEDGSELRGVSHETAGTKWYAIRPADGTLREIPPPLKDARGGNDYGPSQDPLTQPGVRLRLTGNAPNTPAGTPPTPVAVSSLDNSDSVTLAAEGEAVTLLPDGSGALFRSAGTLYVCALRPVSARAVTRWRQEGVKQTTLREARVIAQALFLYWSENDHALPSPSVDLAAALTPRLAPTGAETLKRFRYEPPAAAVADYKVLRDTRAGVLRPTSGSGAATIYAGGRVEWQESQ
jgi:hypothetical protein